MPKMRPTQLKKQGLVEKINASFEHNTEKIETRKKIRKMR